MVDVITMQGLFWLELPGLAMVGLIMLGVLLGYALKAFLTNSANKRLHAELEERKAENQGYKTKQKELEQKLKEREGKAERDDAGVTHDAPSVEESSGKNESVPKPASKFDALKKDNLQIIEGIGPKMESVLKENGIRTWEILKQQDEKTLRNILEHYGNKYKIIDPQSWPDQARLASSSEWPQLIAMQKGIDALNINDGMTYPAKVEKVMVKLGLIKEYKQDDLKAIEGIGPKIAELLTTEGVSTWKDLAAQDQTILQSILDKAGKRFQLADPSSWAKQAALAADGKFDELTEYQESLLGEV